MRTGLSLSISSKRRSSMKKTYLFCEHFVNVCYSWKRASYEGVQLGDIRIFISFKISLAAACLLICASCREPSLVRRVMTLVSVPNPAPGTLRLLAAIMSMCFLTSFYKFLIFR